MALPAEKIIADQIGDRWRRLNSLYWIQDEKGNEIKFRPNAVQTCLDDNLWWLNLILKSRQHGVTTYACLRGLDMALFSPGSAIGIIAHTKEDAGKFFRHKVLYAYERLPTWLTEAVPITRRDMNGTLEFGNGSRIEVSVSHRGGTFNFLHVSEYGPMCAMYPQRAAEVKAGALNTVHDGAIVTLESTAMGREGDFYDRCKRTMEMDELIRAGSASLTRMDYRFFFLGWHRDPRNQLSEPVTITERMEEYFRRLEAGGIGLALPQKYWYVKKAEDQGDKILQEHPSTPEEAFTGTQEGVYYAKELAAARTQGRITRIPVIPSLPVNTFWDLGRNDRNSIWFHQRVGLENRFIAYYESAGQDISHYARYLHEFRDKWKIVYGRHYLPHDAEVVELTRADGKSRKEVLETLNINPIEVVPRIEMLAEGIDMMRQAFPTCYFDEDRCKEGLDHLGKYKMRWNSQVGAFQSDPVKNDARNACLVAGTMIATDHGQIPIEDVRIGDRVVTPWGFRRVLNAGITKMTDDILTIQTSSGQTLRCTPEHKIYANGSFVVSNALRQFDILSTSSGQEIDRWRSARTSSSLKEKNIGFREAITGCYLISAPTKASFTGQFGSVFMARFRKAITFITEMVARTTITLRISNAYRHSTTYLIMPRQALGLVAREISDSLPKPVSSPRSGTPAQKVKSGTPSMEEKRGRIESYTKNSVLSADLNSRHPFQREQNFALTHVKIPLLRALKNAITRNVSALYALLNSAYIATRGPRHVVKIARFDTGGKSVPVYDLTVETDRCYYANGILVSNSDALRQFAQGYESPKIERKTKRRRNWKVA